MAALSSCAVAVECMERPRVRNGAVHGSEWRTRTKKSPLTLHFGLVAYVPEFVSNETDVQLRKRTGNQEPPAIAKDILPNASQSFRNQ